MDLARQLMLQIADDKLQSDEWGEKEIYHLKILSDVGYIDGITFYTSSNGLHFGLANPQLTWAGSEFFDTIRSNRVWNWVKGFLQKKGLDLSVETIKIAVPLAIAAAMK